VLVVDDEADTVMTLLAILRAEGFEAKGLFSGSRALAAMRDFDPDVVILDMAMPGMSGWEVAAAIRGARGAERPILIAISGEYMKSADRSRADLAGIQHYFYKPCDPRVLLTLLSRVRVAS
jgi:DNA-binding response OmpR family regulator